MSNRIYRACQEPIREDPSFDERWRGSDKGLITSWEVGRTRSKGNPELAGRAENRELPNLGWKGGAGDEIDSSDFRVDEFKRPLTIEKLCKAIVDNGYNVSIQHARIDTYRLA